MSIIRYAHPSHIDDLFIAGTDSAFYLKGVAKTNFKRQISGLLRVVLDGDLAIIGGPFNTLEELYEFLAKHFPEYNATKVTVDRIVRKRWSPSAA